MFSRALNLRNLQQSCTESKVKYLLNQVVFLVGDPINPNYIYAECVNRGRDPF